MNECIRLWESCNANKQTNICVCAETVHVLFSVSEGLWRNILAARFQDKEQVNCAGCDVDGSEDYLLVQHLQSFMVTLALLHWATVSSIPENARVCCSALLSMFFPPETVWRCDLECNHPVLGVSICPSDKQHASLCREPSFHVCCVVQDWLLFSR